MFSGFLYHLRGYGLKISMMEWLSLMRGLADGFARSNLTVFYHLGRALLVKKEADFDTFDRAFASYFSDVSSAFDLDEELLQWLENPKLPRELTDEERKSLERRSASRIYSRNFASVSTSRTNGMTAATNGSVQAVLLPSATVASIRPESGLAELAADAALCRSPSRGGFEIFVTIASSIRVKSELRYVG